MAVLRRISSSLALCILLLLPAFLYAQVDSVSTKKKKTAEHYGHQLRLGFDISKPIINFVQSTYKSYEAELDYYLNREIYAVAESGFGSAEYNYPDLSYRSSNAFFRIGVDKTLIKRLNNSDWDAAFIGARYGVALIDRQEATYTITDSLWGTTSGTIPAKAFNAHWAEITGGVRVELFDGISAGWNIRGKFLLTDKTFRELSPVFIAGYGKGDKSTIFDFNFFICYALRWGDEKQEKVTDKGDRTISPAK